MFTEGAALATDDVARTADKARGLLAERLNR